MEEVVLEEVECEEETEAAADEAEALVDPRVVVDRSMLSRENVKDSSTTTRSDAKCRGQTFKDAPSRRSPNCSKSCEIPTEGTSALPSISPTLSHLAAVYTFFFCSS